MTSLRFDDGGCAAMTPATCEAFRASLTSFRHVVITPRSATVVATRDSQLWALKYARFQELSARQPAIALELAMACAAVVVRRLASTTLRVAVT